MKKYIIFMIVIVSITIILLVMYEKMENKLLDNYDDIKKEENNINNIVIENIHAKEYLENVSMRVIDETVSPVGVTIEITDLNKEKEFYDEWYRIDIKNKDGNWEEYPMKDWLYSNSHSDRSIQPNSNVFSRKLNWEKSHGELLKGIYRIVRHSIYDEEIYAEFKIE